MILGIIFQVFALLLDPFGEDGHLSIGGSSVRLMLLVFVDDLLFDWLWEAHLRSIHLFNEYLM